MYSLPYSNALTGSEFPPQMRFQTQPQGQTLQDLLHFQQQTAQMYFPSPAHLNHYPQMGFADMAYGSRQQYPFPGHMLSMPPQVPQMMSQMPSQMYPMGMGADMGDYGSMQIGMDYGLPYAAFRGQRQAPNQGTGVSGRWREDEHEIFLKGLSKYGRKWKKISMMVKSRTAVQIRTHAQKYFQSLKRHAKAAAASGDAEPRVLSEDDEKISQMTDDDNEDEDEDVLCEKESPAAKKRRIEASFLNFAAAEKLEFEEKTTSNANDSVTSLTSSEGSGDCDIRDGAVCISEGSAILEEKRVVNEPILTESQAQ